MKRACIICLFCALCCVFRLNAQIGFADAKLLYSTGESAALPQPDTVLRNLFLIKDIVIEGNRHTRNSTIYRELSFSRDEEYSLSILVEKFNQAKKQLMNTGLFHDVTVSLKSIEGHNAIVNIAVKERWYLYPIPFVKTVDRNLQEWVTQQHMDLSRVNYGIRLNYKNATGRRDRLYVGIMNGYTRQLSFSYEGLALDKNLRWSANLGVAAGENKQLNYITAGNKLQAFKNQDQSVHSYFHSFVELSYRPAINTKHTFGLAYDTESVPDTILAMNPHFFPGLTTVRYPQFYYNLSHYNVDFIPYPTNGYITELSLRKKGLDHRFNLWQISAKASYSHPLNDKYFFNLRAAGMLKLPLRQPYINQQFLGFNSLFLQGYEYYVVDGVAGGYGKATFLRQVLNTTIHIPSQRIKRLNSVPFRLYAKVYGNAGYVYNPQPGPNALNNRLLYTGGVGLDIVSFYDFIIRLEWSFNQLGQNGLYLHRQENF